MRREKRSGQLTEAWGWLLKLGTDGSVKLTRVSEEGQVGLNRHSVPVQRKPPGSLVAYASGLGLLAASVFAGLLVSGQRLGTPWAVACLALVAVVAERASIRLSER